MAKTYAQIQKQIESLAREAEKLRRAEVAGVVARIKEAIATYELTASDLGLRGVRGVSKKAGAVGKKNGLASKRSRVAKYRDAAGNEWVGRGPRPQWLRDALAAGKQLQDFAV